MTPAFIRHDAWNTGRPYTEHGQRIVVWSVFDIDEEPTKDTVALAFLMRDADRGIDYFFGGRKDLFPFESLREYVMHCYDKNRCHLDYSSELYTLGKPPIGNLDGIPTWAPIYL